MKLIAPSILSADFARLGEEVRAVSDAGADWIHVDVMDGRFVPVLTMGPGFVAALRKHTTLPLDVHLMIESPDRHVEAFADGGADWITVHVEACPHLHRVVQRIHELGKRAGVALNPGTPLAAVDAILEHVDLLLVMTVNPGWGGQKAIPSAIRKAGEARRVLDARGLQHVLVEVDGGVAPGNVREFAAADVFVAGSAVFSGDYRERIAALRAGHAASG